MPERKQREDSGSPPIIPQLASGLSAMTDDKTRLGNKAALIPAFVVSAEKSIEQELSQALSRHCRRRGSRGVIEKKQLETTGVF